MTRRHIHRQLSGYVVWCHNWGCLGRWIAKEKRLGSHARHQATVFATRGAARHAVNKTLDWYDRIGRPGQETVKRFEVVSVARLSTEEQQRMVK